MGYTINIDKAKPGEDGVLYGPGDVVMGYGPSGRMVVSRFLIMFTDGHAHGGTEEVITYLATSKDLTAHAWRVRENAGTL